MKISSKKSYFKAGKYFLSALSAMMLLSGCEAWEKATGSKSDSPANKFDFVERNDNENYKVTETPKPEQVEIDTKGYANAELAKKADVKEMWLTHYSPSLTRPEEFMDEVRAIFPNAKPGKDGMSVELDFPEN